MSECDAVAISFSTWITNGSTPIPARIDLPEGRCHGSVVIVPALGQEFVKYHRRAKALGARLARAGFVVCTPDLAMHGESIGGEKSADLAGRWVAEIESCIDAAATHSDGAPVSLVGLRLGACVAAQAQRDVDAIIAWEPLQGRSFVRQQSLLARITLGATLQHDGLDLLGLHLHADQVPGVKALCFAATSPGVVTVGASNSPSMSGTAPVRQSVIDQIIASLPRSLGDTTFDWPRQASVVFPWTAGQSLKETFCTVGPELLTGVSTVAERQSHPTQGFVFTALGAELRCGPGSVWACAAREAASMGAICLRADRRRIGDMVADFDCNHDVNPYTTDAVDDVVSAVDLVYQTGVRSITAVGACAGAWLCLQASMRGRVETVLAYSCLLWNLEARDCAVTLRGLSPVDAKTGDHGRRYASKVAVANALRRRLARILQAVARSRQAHSWYNALLGVKSGGLGAPLLKVLPAEVKVSAVLDLDDYRSFTLIGGRVTARYLQQRGRSITVRRSSALDHSLFSERSRRLVASDVVELLGRD